VVASTKSRANRALVRGTAALESGSDRFKTADWPLTASIVRTLEWRPEP
jgi:hypothetical protein